MNIKLILHFIIIISDILLDEFNLEQLIIKNENNIEKNYKCISHKNEAFNSYCLQCKKNLCFICENNNEHDILSYNKILSNCDEYINKLNKNMENFRNKY